LHCLRPPAAAASYLGGRRRRPRDASGVATRLRRVVFSIEKTQSGVPSGIFGHFFYDFYENSKNFHKNRKKNGLSIKKWAASQPIS